MVARLSAGEAHLSTPIVGLFAGRAGGLGTLSVVLAAVFVLARPIWASATPMPSYAVTAAAAVSGTAKPYRLDLIAEANQGAQYAELTLSRTAPTGNHPLQRHRFHVSPSSTSCTWQLASCTIADLGQMGQFGTLDLRFTPSAAGTTADRICGGVVVGTVMTRPGALTGVLRLKTGTSYFGTVRNGAARVRVPASIPASAQKYTPNGAACGSRAPGPCQPGFSLLSFSGLSKPSATRVSSESTAVLSVSFDDVTNVSAVTVKHVVSGRVPAASFAITSNVPKPLQAARVDFGAMAPFATGNARFDGSGDPSSPDSCGQMTRSGWLTGTLRVTFDGFGLRANYGGNAALTRVP